MVQHDSLINRMNNNARNSVTLRLVAIGILTLILLIPTNMIEDLVYERQSRQYTAIDEVSSKWANYQTITGLILTVPYKEEVISESNGIKNVSLFTSYAHFLPETLNIAGVINPEVRYRGIYEVIVYITELSFVGSFPQPDFSDWDIPTEHIMWEDAFISIGIPDMRGIEKRVKTQWNNDSVLFNPGIANNDVISSGISAKVKLLPQDSSEKKTYNFAFDLSLKGSSYLKFIPLGRTTDVSISSKWTTPSFEGAFLPDERDINENGFTAHWEVLHLNRNYPQQWIGYSFSVHDSEFGVNLLLPIDQYQKNYRSVKYALMIIALTFIIFFFVEVFNKNRIHPIQYTLVGSALVIFYTLLLAISEHLNFDVAYLISATAVIGLILVYVHSIFKNNRLTRILGLVLLILYGFVYTTLQLEDFALLLGSVGLFVVLAIIMYLSRKVNWYDISLDKNEQE